MRTEGDCYISQDGTRYVRVSTLASYVAGDMRHAVAQMTAKGARSVIESQLATFGTIPAGDDLQKLVHAEYTRADQSVKDRGTVVNLLFDEMVTNGELSPSDALLFCEDAITAHQVKASSEWDEYYALKKAGLIDGDEPKPERGYQCTIDDVAPFALSLVNGWGDFDIEVLHLQQRLTQEGDRLIAGTSDAIGVRRGGACVFELKTQGGSPSVMRSWQAQIAQYVKMASGSMGGHTVTGIVGIVTPEKFVLRELTALGYERGIADIENAYDLHTRSGMRGSFLSVRQTAQEVQS